MTASFVADPDPLTSGSDPGQMTEFDGDLYFTAKTEALGRELYKTDGTEAGTVLVKDIIPGSSGSSPTNLTVVGGSLFFVAGSGIWKTDGTEAGTTQVKAVSNRNTVRHLTNLNGTLLFVEGNDPEIWRSDGTEAGTVKVTTNAGWVYSMVAVGGYAYFSDYSDSGIGEELYRTDGTAAGTELVKDIRPNLSSGPGNLTNVGGTLYFTANDGSTGVELYKSDGTAAGTVLVKDIRASGSSSPGNLTNVDGTLYFTANDGSTGVELYKSDGTAAGTVLVKDIYSGAPFSSPTNLTASDGKLFFKAADATAYSDLWVSDGTAAGTTPMRVNPTGFPSDNFTSFTDVAGTLFFTAGQYQNVELWKSDGTTAGTVEVKDINPGTDNDVPSSLKSYDGKLLFAATDGAVSYSGTELWSSDGTAAGTELLADINKGAETGSGSVPVYLTDVGGALFFASNDRVHGQEIWQSDGTPVGTGMVKDVLPGPNGNVDNLVEFGGKLLFRGSASDLWRSDGTEAGTTLVKAGGAGAVVRNVGGALYGWAYESAAGIELWRSDGTEAGTGLVKDIYPGTSHSFPNGFTEAGDHVYFVPTSGDGTNGAELWRTDGTEAGTELVKDIYPGPTGSSPSLHGAVGDALLFSADDGNGRKLWKTDGTPGGTEPVSAAYPSSGQAIVFGEQLFFGFDDGSHGTELWKSDGTAAGTELVADINPSGSSNPYPFTELNGELVFRADVGGDSRLWRSDGTAGGTEQVADINPTGYDNVGGITEANGVALFYANGGPGTGLELWKSDGTEAGTSIVADIYPGSGDSSPTGITAVGDDAYFVASDPDHAWGIWKADIQGPAPPKPDITSADPSSPSSDRTPLIKGSAPGSAAAVEVFTQEDCQGPATTGTKAEFEGAGIEVEVDADATTTLSARSLNGDGAPSPCSEPIDYTHDETAPAAPEITATDPASPSSDASPAVKGTAANDATAVEVFAQADCQGTSTPGAKASFEGSGIDVTVGANATTQLSARVRDAAGNWSDCSSSFPYTHDDVAPDAPQITATDPASPSSDATPLVKGTADATATRVRIFTEAACSGTPVDDSKAAFEGAGIETAVPANETSELSARARDAAGNWSSCAEGPGYTHDDVGPAAPTINSTDPGSPASDPTPKVKGTSAADAASIEIFTQADCQGTPATGTKALFEGAGIAAAVDLNATTALSARAKDAAGNASDCSAPLDYTHDDIAPAAPTISASTPASPANDNAPRIRGTAEADSSVDLYLAAGCDSSNPLGTSTAATFASAGIQVSVSDNTTTAFAATATDAAGNTSTCSAPFAYEELTPPPPSPPDPDTTPPQTRIDAGPKKKVKSKKASFSFSSNEPGSRFECKLDKSTYQACRSPMTVKAKKGRHLLAVRAVDAAGNVDPSPATWKWQVKKKRKKRR